MNKIMAPLLILTGSITLILVSCTCMAGTRSIATAHAPAKCPWSEAYIESKNEPAHIRGSDMGPRRTGASITHTLVLKGASGERRVLIDSAGEWEEIYSEIKNRLYDIQFAPDCHALALSINGKKDYRYVALDSGDRPFYCRHRIIHAAGSDLWTNAPTTRSLVLEILGSNTTMTTGKDINHADIMPESIDIHNYGDLDRMNRLEYNFLPELWGAVSFSAAHPEDAGVRSALARALFMPGHQLDKSDDEDAVSSLAGLLARTNGDVRDILTQELRGPYFSRAAKSLANTPDRRVQELLADILEKNFSGAVSDDSCKRIIDLTWTLVSVTISLRDGSARTLEILGRIAGGNERCPLIKKDWPNEAVSERGRAARRLAVKGLAAVRKPKAREILTRLSSGPCQAHADRDGKDVILNPNAKPSAWSPGLKSYFSELIEEREVRMDIACWAKAALQYESKENK